jgi:hypothetical protein
MKFRITFHDPDAVQDSLEEACRATVDDYLGLTSKEKTLLIESRVEKSYEFLDRWLDCQEYVTIEFDTEAGTAVVVESK